MRHPILFAVMGAALLSACATHKPTSGENLVVAPTPNAPPPVGAPQRREPCGGGPVSPFLHNSDQKQSDGGDAPPPAEPQ